MEPEKSLRQQIDDTVIDMRNELIMQGTNAFLFGRQCVLIGLGLTFMAADQLQAFAQQAIERGEIAETDVQQRLGKVHHEVVDGATAAVSTRLSALLNKAPGVNVAYQPPAKQTPAEQTPPASSEPS
jgi:hypothetical protein